MANPDMMRFHLKDYLKRKKVAYYQARRDYVEDYFEKRLDYPFEAIPFSSDKRDLHNMKIDMWLACGNVAVASENEELKENFIKSATKADF